LDRNNIRQPQPSNPRYEPTLTAEDEAEEWGQPRNKGKKKTNKRRELVFDENRGEVVARRKHKRRGNQDWNSDDE
jgi:hypothetical protein